MATLVLTMNNILQHLTPGVVICLDLLDDVLIVCIDLLIA